MNITVLTVPGKFPTVIHDPGLWTYTVSEDMGKLNHYSANYFWWEEFFSEGPSDYVKENKPVLHNIINKLKGVDLALTSYDSFNALKSLTTFSAYETSEHYISTIKRLYNHIKMWDRFKTDLTVDLVSGIRVKELNYSSLNDVIEYSLNEGTLLYKITEEALADVVQIPDFLVVNITCPEELLTALVCAKIIRKKSKNAYICLADHGYENFSLHFYMDKLQKDERLFEILDSIVAKKEHLGFILPRLIISVKSGRTPKGILYKEYFEEFICPEPDYNNTLPPIPIYSWENILWTRLSSKKCYWSKCTFCVQNTKYEETTCVTINEIDESLIRIHKLIESGYENIIFSDEAVSLSVIKYFCEKILEMGLKFRWTLRCRIEKGFSDNLISLMKKAGCFEILFGLETISPGVQEKMKKYDVDIDKEFVKELFQSINARNIGLHVNFITGFPGERLWELSENMNFAINCLKGLDNTTYLLNIFTLFKGSLVANDPESFLIKLEEADDDMPYVLEYSFKPEIEKESKAVQAMIPKLSELVYDKLGWSKYGVDIDSLNAVYLYFTSGHGSIFKTMENNPFKNPLKSESNF